MPAAFGPITEITPKAAPMASVRRRPKSAADLLRRGVGGHVVVLRRSAEQLIADAAARPIGLEPRPAQAANHFGGETALFLGG